jgi:hypothetical protein
VESKNDKVFIEALVKFMNLQNIEVETPICKIDDYECMGGLDHKKLKQALNEILKRLKTEEVKSIGIILDDDGKKKKRLRMINNAAKDVFNIQEEFSDTGYFIEVPLELDIDDKIKINLGCYLLNVDGKGELETLLKAIKCEESVYADCLEKWRDCLESKGEKISIKEFNKLWVHNYIRWDTCSKQERKQAYRKCSIANFEYIMQNKSYIWNFDDKLLDGLKNFINLFQ